MSTDDKLKNVCIVVNHDLQLKKIYIFIKKLIFLSASVRLDKLYQTILQYILILLLVTDMKVIIQRKINLILTLEFIKLTISITIIF